MSLSRIGPFVLLLLLVLGTAHAHAASPAAVRYDADMLVVDGVEYPREPPLTEGFAPGRVVVQPKPGREAAVESLLKRLGLKVVEREGAGLVVEVPAGFEWQWNNALADVPDVDRTALQ